IKFLIGIISLVFVFYFGYSFTSKRGSKMATVNGELITRLAYDKEYRDMVESFRRQYRGAWNDNLIKVLDLKNRALQNLINRKLISQEAKKLGFQVTKTEIQKSIMAYPAFQVNGQFDVRRYQALLDQNRMKPEDFEQNIAQELLQKKLQQFLLTFLPVTDKELLDAYTLSHEQVNVAFIQIKPDRFTSTLKIDPSAMEAYFKAHQEDYRVPEKIKLAYITIDPADFKERIRVSEKEIKEYYEYNMDSFKVPAKVCARHILFRLKENATKAEAVKVQKKAEAVLKMARAGKDFAKLAKKYSEGPTGKNGGDLGCFSRGKMVKPFEEAAFKLKKGEISDLVKTRFGYHIIKVENVQAARTKSVDEVRSQIEDSLKKNEATDLAHEKGLSLIDQMPYEVDLSTYAAENKLAVHYTDSFSLNDPIPGIGGDEKLRESLFSLQKNEASELIELQEKFYIFQVAGRKASYLPELKDVKEAVKRDFLQHLAAEKAKAVAQKYLHELTAGKEWKKVAAASGVKAQETGFFTRQGPVPKIGYDQGLIETVFHLNKSKRYPEKVFENQAGAFLIRWEGSKGIDPQKFQKEKEQYRFSLMRLKQQTAFQNWLDALRKKARVEIVAPVS
ncbi:MAG: SurA N-terminal domain-containing protein, partial [Deltaproteobacteria bacterium]|nr:SurA N-terminal domain-containing protein [Deltaproteobacteria bacterium]